LLFLTAQAGAPSERDFLGRKIHTVPLPAMPAVIPGTSSSVNGPRTLHYAASGGYVAFSTDGEAIEAYLRSSETQGKALRDLPGLADAVQKVTVAGTSLLAYENQAAMIKPVYEALRQHHGRSTNAAANLLPNIPGMARAESKFEHLPDFSLLPPFDKVAKYFHYSVSAFDANSDGLGWRAFFPTPPGLRAASAGEY
jgi:hypothetical protein